MKKIKLTGKIGKGKYTLIDDSDFLRVSKYKWHLSSNKNYVLRQQWDVKTKKTYAIMLHRFIMSDILKTQQIDHINGNKLDNRKSNLRLCNNSQNQANINLKKNNTSGFKSVWWCKRSKKWNTAIGFNYKRINLGYFTTKELAAKAYNLKAKELFGEFALLNNI